ncbi:MAG: cytochrome c biogenesis protein CcsA [Ignavibacteriae bacterium]|nr:cytochrome c biogenesis protein CcsA [Ignavibacteriota bacterium]
MNNLLKYLIFIIITGVLIAGILLPIPFIPALGDKARIIYLHVPMSWIAVLAFLMSMIYSIGYLKSRDLNKDIVAYSSAEIGFLFSILATVTGSLWAKFNWGSFWNWDPRETSIFILLLIYGAYFSLRSAIENPEQKAKLSSVYSIIAFVTVPFFIFIMPRIVESLHPEDTIVNSEGKINMNPVMFTIFMSSLAGFTMFYFWLLNLKVRVERLNHKSD